MKYVDLAYRIGEVIIKEIIIVELGVIISELFLNFIKFIFNKIRETFKFLY